MLFSAVQVTAARHSEGLGLPCIVLPAILGGHAMQVWNMLNRSLLCFIDRRIEINDNTRAHSLSCLCGHVPHPEYET
ncbi:hypothetical protein E2C01_095275 [Portunus trituberculatus]|uniref:Uncharacterized protein n=1 Tax=Portunus trituberculatus TaxID=210409 RepID=A0A5B7K5D0_PORTR|nr:hypothetical protein [Portunus trituberculatus]